MTRSASFRLSAVGDISFEGSEADSPSPDCFGDLTRIFHRSDLVVGNLECVLVHKGDAIPGKCTLRGSPQWASIMRNAGIGLVSLANNHVMDYGKQGLFSTIEALSQAGIRYIGAGRNRREACSPLFLDVAGRRIAFLARSAVIVSAPTYAGENDPGVAFLDAEETAATIWSCRLQADLVILLAHWGVEEYSYPSPTQRQLARQFVDAGVNIILGHHPHVLQGFEYYQSALIAYSLGNFVFNEFKWTYIFPDGAVSRQVSPLSPENRKGIIATLEWTGLEGPVVTATYTRIEPHGRVCVDADPARKPETEVLSAGMLRRCYRLWWQWYAIHREWSLRLGEQISFPRIITNLRRLRLRHLNDVFGSLRRSARIVSEKTTNPYE
jgi:hypothetical protein